MKLHKEPQPIVSVVNTTLDKGLSYDTNLDTLLSEIDSFDLPDYSKYISEVMSLPLIGLSRDPTTEGISILNVKLAEVQAHKSRLISIKLECLLTHSELERFYRAAEVIYEDELNQLMLRDDISKLRNVSQQKAAATKDLDPKVKSLYWKSKELLSRSESFLKFLETKLTELQDINANISRQVTVCQIEANLLK